ncbi:MAG: GNAT family N-acetyltransferase [Firmicutes bacterium]|nr:GNAT family N-acetyltransferase [Bacillota bacterium]
MIRIIPTEEHEDLNGFYEKNGLEISDDEPVSTDALVSFKVFDGEEFAGACTLAFRQNEYIIDGIAVDGRFRGQELGTGLLKAAIDEVRKRGGKRIYLVARAPEFFRENGFETVERQDAPEFFECFGCNQYNKSCFPEVMKYVI